MRNAQIGVVYSDFVDSQIYTRYLLNTTPLIVVIKLIGIHPLNLDLKWEKLIMCLIPKISMVIIFIETLNAHGAVHSGFDHRVSDEVVDFARWSTFIAIFGGVLTFDDLEVGDFVVFLIQVGLYSQFARIIHTHWVNIQICPFAKVFIELLRCALSHLDIFILARYPPSFRHIRLYSHIWIIINIKSHFWILYSNNKIKGFIKTAHLNFAKILKIYCIISRSILFFLTSNHFIQFYNRKGCEDDYS